MSLVMARTKLRTLIIPFHHETLSNITTIITMIIMMNYRTFLVVFAALNLLRRFDLVGAKVRKASIRRPKDEEPDRSRFSVRQGQASQHLQSLPGRSLKKSPKKKKKKKKKTKDKCIISNDLFIALELLGDLHADPELMEEYGEKRIMKTLSPIAEYIREVNPKVEYPPDFFRKYLETYINQPKTEGNYCSSNNDEQNQMDRYLQQAEGVPCLQELIGLIIEFFSLMLAIVFVPDGILSPAAKAITAILLTYIDLGSTSPVTQEFFNKLQGKVTVKWFFNLFAFIFSVIGGGPILKGIGTIFTEGGGRPLKKVWFLTQIALSLVAITASGGAALALLIAGLAAAFLDVSFASVAYADCRNAIGAP